MERKFAPTKFGKIAYVESGRGPNVLVFFHGFLGRPELVAQTAKAFEGNYRVVAPYLPGHGPSFMIPSGFDFDDLVVVMTEWLNEILRGQSVKKVVLVGHSLGGAIAWEVAAVGPAQVEEVILIDPGLGLVGRSVVSKILSYFKNVTVDFPGSPIGDFFRMAHLSWGQIWNAGRLDSMLLGMRVCTTGLPKRIKVVALWGKDDGLTPIDEYKPLLSAAKVPVTFFPGSHHWFMARPQLYLAQLRKLL